MSYGIISPPLRFICKMLLLRDGHKEEKAFAHRVSAWPWAGSSSSQGEPQRAQKDLASPGMGQGQDHSCRQLHPSALRSYMSPDHQKGWNAAKLHC